jgi:hypothetical protein
VWADPAVGAFVWIALFLAISLVAATFYAWRRSGAHPAATRRATSIAAAASLLWMALTWALAAGGVLGRWDRLPPPFAVMMLVALALAAFIAFGPFGTRAARTIPVWLLVGVQGFRLPLELAMHAMYVRGIMPVQMSYSGRNFDILTGASALLVASSIVAGLGGRRLAMWWNAAGLALLLNIMVVAIASTPTFRMFGDDRLNVWITRTPFVWLPAVMVLSALAGHLLLFRALRPHRSAP